jgi:hypothetical protein
MNGITYDRVRTYHTPDTSVTIRDRAEARDYAVTWQHEFADRVMDWAEAADWGELFAAIGFDWGLTDEFRNEGII